MAYNFSDDMKEESLEDFDPLLYEKFIIDPQVQCFIDYFESLGITIANNARYMAYGIQNYSIKGQDKGFLWMEFIKEIIWDALNHANSDIDKSNFLLGSIYFLDSIFSVVDLYIGSTLKDVYDYTEIKIKDYAKKNKLDPEHQIFAGFILIPLVSKNNKWPEGFRFTPRALMIFYEYYLKTLKKNVVINHFKKYGILSDDYKSYLESETKKPHLN